MSQAKSRPPDYRVPILAPLGTEGQLHAIWPERTFRFMFNDGSILDVRSSRDDSDLRFALLEHLRVSRKLTKDNDLAIVGSTTINEGDADAGES